MESQVNNSAEYQEEEICKNIIKPPKGMENDSNETDSTIAFLERI